MRGKLVNERKDKFDSDPGLLIKGIIVIAIGIGQAIQQSQLLCITLHEGALTISLVTVWLVS